MTIQDCIDVIEKLLKHNDRTYKDSHDQLLYERGYLTGMLARLMIENPMIRIELIDRERNKFGG